MRVWDTRVSHACQRSYKHSSPVSDVALHPNQGELLSCDAEGTVRVWDLTNNQCVREMRSELATPLTRLCIAPDASAVVAASYKGQVFSWRLSGPPPPQNNFASSSSSSSSSSASSASAASPSCSSGLSPSPNLVFDAHPTYCLKALFSPDCQWLATTGADASIKIWSLDKDKNSYTLSRSLLGHSQWVWDCAFSADSAYLVSASSDKVAKLWDREAGECILEYKGHQKAITAIALNDAS